MVKEYSQSLHQGFLLSVLWHDATAMAPAQHGDSSPCSCQLGCFSFPKFSPIWFLIRVSLQVMKHSVAVEFELFAQICLKRGDVFLTPSPLCKHAFSHLKSNACTEQKVKKSLTWAMSDSDRGSSVLQSATDDGLWQLHDDEQWQLCEYPEAQGSPVYQLSPTSLRVCSP